MDFTEYLSARRMRLGITQKELAEKAKISTSYLNLIETGKKRPTPTVIRRIGDVLGSDPEIMLDLAGYKVPELPGEKASEKGEEHTNIRIIGAIGGKESIYYGSQSKFEQLEADTIKILDDSFIAFGYQKGDMLMLEEGTPSPGDVVVLRKGGGDLAIVVYDKSMFEERILGRVVGLIRRFDFDRTSEEESAGEISADEVKSEVESLKKTLSEMQAIISKLATGSEDSSNNRENS